MGKKSTPRRLADNEAKAELRNVRISPIKLNLVAALIRGLKVDKALANLTFSKKRISNDVKKLLESAVANADVVVLRVESHHAEGLQDVVHVVVLGPGHAAVQGVIACFGVSLANIDFTRHTPVAALRGAPGILGPF